MQDWLKVVLATAERPSVLASFAIFLQGRVMRKRLKEE